MLDLSSKIVICMLLVSSGWDHTQPRPIKSTEVEQQQQILSKNSNRDASDNSLNNGNRAQRQVVAPAWLNPKTQPQIDSRVHVTAENLREAEAIRKAIQKTVDEGTFAVDPDQPTPGKSSNSAHHPVKTQPSPTKTPPTQSSPTQSSPTQTPQPTPHNNRPTPDVPKQTTDFNPNNIMNGFGQNWLTLFEHSRNLWTDRELWGEIKSHWFDLLDNSKKMWTDWF